MAMTKDKIWAQIQQDSAAYDAFSDALKQVLIKEVQLARNPGQEDERRVVISYNAASAYVA